MRPRKKDRHLPPCVHHRHGAFWLVERDKWTRLGAELSPALAQYARLIAVRSGAMGALIDDLRAMSGPAARRQSKNPTELLGQKNPAMTVRYLRDREIPEAGGPSFGQVLDLGHK
jgi:hypothetical protein